MGKPSNEVKRDESEAGQHEQSPGRLPEQAGRLGSCLGACSLWRAPGITVALAPARSVANLVDRQVSCLCSLTLFQRPDNLQYRCDIYASGTAVTRYD